MTLKIAFIVLAGGAILWRRSTDSQLPWTLLWVLACVFLSRVYWLTAAGTLRLEQLACLVLFVHFIVDLLRQRKWPRLELLPLLLLAMLPLMVLGSLLASPFPAASLRKTLIYFPYLGGFIALCYFLDSGTKLASAWDFLIRFGTGIMALSLACYFLFLAGIDLGMVRVEGGVIWLRGSLVNPNIFGAAAGMVLISTLARFLSSAESSARRSVFDLGALIVSSASLVVSFSRASWLLAVAAAAAVFLFTRRERSNWLPAVSVILLTILITIAITIVGSKAYNFKLSQTPGLKSKTTGEFGELVKDRFVSASRMASVPTSTPFQQRLRYNYSSFRWRFSISIRALRDWLKSPVLGRGTDSLMLSHPTIPQYYLPVSWVVILHDWGIVALALYAAFLLLVGFRLWKRLVLDTPAPGLFLAIFLVFLFHTLQTQFSTTLQLGSFWVLSAIFAVAAGKPAFSEPAGGARSLRVGFDAKWFFSATSSSRVMVRNILGELVARNKGMELFLFLRRCDRHRDFPYYGPRIHPVYVAGRPNLLANLVTLPWKAWRLGLDVGVFQYFAPPFCRCQRIVIIHDIIFTEHPEFFSLAERLYFSPMRWLARRAQAICTISQVEKTRLVRHGFGEEEKIAVLHPGISSSFQPLDEIPTPRREDVRSRYGLPPRFLLYLGRLNVRKNIVNLLRAQAMLQDRTIPLVLAGVALGRGKAIDAEIRRLHLEERIICPGFVDDEDLPVLMGLATIFCYVSHDEGFGLPVLEAMACGVAVVVSQNEVMREICGPAGNYVDGQDPSAIAVAIDRLLAEPAARKQKAAQGLVHSRQFSWGRSAETLLALCQEHPAGSPAHESPGN